MSLNSTPSSERIHISFFGKRNAGKSSLINAITNQNISIVSEIKGTTTDPVQKAMELLPLGPVVITDTAGFDDEGDLGKLRVEKTLQVLNKTDIAILTTDARSGLSAQDTALINIFEEKNIKYIIVYNKSDLITEFKPLKENDVVTDFSKRHNNFKRYRNNGNPDRFSRSERQNNTAPTASFKRTFRNRLNKDCRKRNRINSSSELS